MREQNGGRWAKETARFKGYTQHICEYEINITCKHKAGQQKCDNFHAFDHSPNNYTEGF